MKKRAFALLLSAAMLLSACADFTTVITTTSKQDDLKTEETPSGTVHSEENVLTPEERDEMMRLAGIHEQYVLGRDYELGDNVDWFAVGYLYDAGVLVSDEEGGAYTFTAGELYDIADCLTGGYAGEEPDDREYEQSWWLYEEENPIELSVVESSKSDGKAEILFSRKCEGFPLRPVQYSFEMFEIGQDIPELLSGAVTPGQEFIRISRVENKEPDDIVRDNVEIAAPEELIEFTKAVNSGDVGSMYGNVTLTSDLDMTGYEMEPIGTYASKLYYDDERNPFGSGFCGVFDGNGHTISNVHIDMREKDGEGSFAVGLFSHLDEEGAVMDLTLENAEIYASDDYMADFHSAGGMFGSVEGKVINCHVKNVKVSGYNDVGGFAGSVSMDAKYLTSDAVTGGRISYCTAENVEVTGCDAVGVFIGTTHYGYTRNCTANGKAISEKSAIEPDSVELPRGFGGFCGFSVGGVIERCATEGVVYTNASTSWLGNFLGYNQGKVYDSYVKESSAWWAEDVDVHYPDSVAEVTRVADGEYGKLVEKLLTQP